MPLQGPTTGLEQRRDQANAQRIREYYAWGQQIRAIRQREHVPIGAAIARLGRSESRFTGYKALKFAEWRREDLAYVVANGREGRPLSWSHVIVLVSVERAPERRRLMRQAVRRGWSAARLRAEIRPGENRRPNSGRRFQGLERPEDIFRALAGYLQRPRRFLTRVMECETLRLSDVERQSVTRLQRAIERFCSTTR
jgi:hypothetical protein